MLNTTLASFKEKGVTVAETIAPDQQAVLLEYQGESNPEYWLGLQNFYVITRYNRSSRYGMAVQELAEQLRNHYEAAS